MGTLTKISSAVSAPSAVEEYGKGDFLVGFWGETIKYTKDAQLWYEHPKHYDWSKGNYADLSDFSANDNDKTLDFTSTPIFIQSFHILYSATGTVGQRALYFTVGGSQTANFSYNKFLTASQHCFLHTGYYSDADIPSSYLEIGIPKFWSDGIPFWNKIRIVDAFGVDTNDDMQYYFTGVYALPKYNWIELKNCKNFQVQKVIESLSDGKFTIGSSLPRSLKVLKI